MSTDNKQTEYDLDLAWEASIATLDKLSEIVKANDKVSFCDAMAFILESAAVQLAYAGWTTSEIKKMVSASIKAQAEYDKQFQQPKQTQDNLK